MLEIRTDSTTYRHYYIATLNGAITQKGGVSFRVATGGQRSGSEVANWKKIIRSGGNATSDFSANELVLKRVPIYAYCDHQNKVPPFTSRSDVTKDYFADNQGDGIPTTTAIPSSLTARVDIQAREQFLQKYRDARTSIQLGVFGGELLRTVRMIKSPAKALREGINAYYRDVKKRTRRKRGKRPDLRKIVSETWLEYVFGWRPLIRDVEGICRLTCADPARYRKRITSIASENYKLEPQHITKSAPSIGSPPWWIEHYQQENTFMVRYIGAADATMMTPTFPEQLGLDWSNFLPTVWELIPFSFLVDYFSNVGAVIEGISTGNVALAYGVRTQRTTRCTKMYTEYDHKNTRITLGADRTYQAGVTGAGMTGQRKDITRTRISSIGLGLNDLRFKIPGVGSLKWLNIAALATLRT